jgi:hypothetical protein
VATQSEPLLTQDANRNRLRAALQNRWAFLVLGLALGVAGAQLTRLAEAWNGDSVQSALALENQALAAGEMQSAYDALLEALRIAPGDERVFAASLAFVQQAARSDDEDTLTLAEDIHQRAGNSIPYLPLSRIKSARTEHADLAKALYPAKPRTKAEDPLADSETLLKGALDTHIPSFVRSRMLHDAELELGNQATRFAVLPKRSDEREGFWARWQNLKRRYDQAQIALLTSLYQEDCQPRLAAWLKRADSLMSEASKDDLEPTEQLCQRLLDLATEGQRLERELSPYLEGSVEAAIKGSEHDALTKRIVRLSELREWNYNRWALAKVQEGERSGSKGLDTLKLLATVDEARLSEYLGRRLAEAWKKNFDACNEDEKLEASKLRILREFQQ